MFVKLKVRVVASLIIITAKRLVCLYLLHPFCMWTPRILPRSPLVRLFSGPLSQNEPCTGLPWRFRQWEGASIRGAGKNAEFSSYRAQQRTVSSPPGRRDTVISSTKTGQINPRKAVRAYATQGLAVMAAGAVYTSFMNPKAEHAAVSNDGRWADKVRTCFICLSEISFRGVIISSIE
jgi:hypothetical protein